MFNGDILDGQCNGFNIYDEDFDSYESSDEYTVGPSPTKYHEAIKSVQKQKSNKLKKKKGPREIKPTETFSIYWIYEFSSQKYPDPTNRSGKWLIFADSSEINDAWSQIKFGLKSGQLGSHAKVSTAKRVLNNNFVICVYTYDWTDYEDVMRIREALRDLGFEKMIPYKTDEDTLKKKYSGDGTKRIAKYYE